MTVATPPDSGYLSGTVVCRNRMGGPTVLASDPKSTHEVIFQGREDPAGQDYQVVPEQILKTPAFARSVALGIIEVIQGNDNDTVRQAMQHQSDAFWQRQERDQVSARESLDAPQDNDLISVACIGPGTRPGAVCGENIPVRAREATANPPLCSRHAGMASQCYRRGDGPWKLDEEPVTP